MQFRNHIRRYLADGAPLRRCVHTRNHIIKGHDDVRSCRNASVEFELVPNIAVLILLEQWLEGHPAYFGWRWSALVSASSKTHPKATGTVPLPQ